METKTKYISSTSSFTGALTILFIALKLLDKISWKWIWVLSPIWISWIIAIILNIIVLILKDRWGY